MTYAQNNRIDASDFNGLVGSSTTSTTGELNAIWALGNGNRGYGQTAIPQVTQNNPVYPTDWANVVNRCSTIAAHQSTTITAVTAPVQGTRIDYVSGTIYFPPKMS